MTRVRKSAFNVREKLTELGRRFGLKGSELAGAETLQEARDLVSAGRKNIIINGDMRVAQRGTSTTVSDDSTNFTVDRFAFYRGGLSTTLTGTQQSVTDLAEHNKSLRITSTGNATIGANTDGWLKYNIEDKDFDNVNWINGSNKHVTLSFWAKSNRTGQFSVNISAGNFSAAKNIKTYTLDFVDTWKKIEVTFPAPSTWAYNLNRGAIIYWSMALGTTYYTSNPNTGWMYSNNKIGTVGDTQIYGDNGAYFEITGVQLELGKNATDFEYSSYGEELALCQRYFYKFRLANQEWIYNEGNGANNKWHQFYIGHSMRPISAIDVTDVTVGGSIGGLGGTVNSYAPQTPGDTPSRVSSRVTMSATGGTARNIYHYDGWNEDYISVSAEL